MGGTRGNSEREERRGEEHTGFEGTPEGQTLLGRSRRR